MQHSINLNLQARLHTLNVAIVWETCFSNYKITGSVSQLILSSAAHDVIPTWIFILTYIWHRVFAWLNISIHTLSGIREIFLASNWCDGMFRIQLVEPHPYTTAGQSKSIIFVHWMGCTYELKVRGVWSSKSPTYTPELRWYQVNFHVATFFSTWCYFRC